MAELLKTVLEPFWTGELFCINPGADDPAGGVMERVEPVFEELVPCVVVDAIPSSAGDAAPVIMRESCVSTGS